MTPEDYAYYKAEEEARRVAEMHLNRAILELANFKELNRLRRELVRIANRLAAGGD